MGEWFDGVFQYIMMNAYDGLFTLNNRIFSNIFVQFNNQISEASTTLRATPQSWNSTAYGVIQTLAENVFVPIAAAFITIVFCWELVHLVQESNSMQQISVEKIVLVLFKLCLCLLVCSKAFNIVMAFFELGGKATALISGSSIGTFGEGISFANIMTPPDMIERYKFIDILISFGAGMYSAGINQGRHHVIDIKPIISSGLHDVNVLLGSK